jgi:hypothetical protein
MIRPSGWALLFALVLTPCSAWAQEDPRTDPSVVPLEDVLKAGDPRATLSYYRRILEAFAQGRKAAAAEGRNWLLMPFAPYGPVTQQNAAKVRELTAWFKEGGHKEDAALGEDLLAALRDLQAARTPLLATVLSGLAVEYLATLQICQGPDLSEAYYTRVRGFSSEFVSNHDVLESGRKGLRACIRAIRSAMDESSPLVRDTTENEITEFHHARQSLRDATSEIEARLTSSESEDRWSRLSNRWSSLLGAIDDSWAYGFLSTFEPALGSIEALNPENAETWERAEERLTHVAEHLPFTFMQLSTLWEPVSAIAQLVKRGNIVLLPTLARTPRSPPAFSLVSPRWVRSSGTTPAWYCLMSSTDMTPPMPKIGRLSCPRPSRTFLPARPRSPSRRSRVSWRGSRETPG